MGNNANEKNGKKKKKKGCLLGCLIPILVIAVVFGAVLIYAAFRIETNDEIKYALTSDENAYYVVGTGKNVKARSSAAFFSFMEPPY